MFTCQTNGLMVYFSIVNTLMSVNLIKTPSMSVKSQVLTSILSTVCPVRVTVGAEPISASMAECRIQPGQVAASSHDTGND